MKKENSERELEFGIYEVYYNEDGGISGWSEESMTPTCSSADDLKHEMQIMMLAFEKESIVYTKDEKTTRNKK